ncbi:MAG: 1-deoxy-D-xylulose-5-phosphate reductoisomerase, partial [Candidatus Bipolaricaulota bacterium]|nr:1-deoxy-D-xylulose-5-phosphate reductoisomerase [Candidatus Bipolaricaulota bacterium]
SRITIDSATMVNKAFEVIEAHYLFDVPYERIDPVIHPQSVIHSLVEYQDGSIIAELAASDMRIPIQYALTYPERVATGLPRLSLAKISGLSFEALDVVRYPAFATVLAAGKRAGTAPTAVNAADEILVGRFLRGQIGFMAIVEGLQKILDRWTAREDTMNEELTLARILEVDRWSREQAEALRP